MTFNIALDFARKIENRRTAFDAKHRLTLADKVDPAVAIKAVFLSKGDVDRQTGADRVIAKDPADLVFFVSQIAQPSRHLSRPITDIDWSLGIWQHGFSEQTFRNISREYIDLDYAGKLFRGIHFFDLGLWNAREQHIDPDCLHRSDRGMDVAILVLDKNRLEAAKLTQCFARPRTDISIVASNQGVVKITASK